MAQASKILKRVDLVQLEKEYKQWKNIRKPKEKDEVVYYALVSYEELKGLGNKRKYKRFETYAVIYNGWAYLSSGRRKSISGRRFWIVEKYDDKPEQISDNFASSILRQ